MKRILFVAALAAVLCLSITGIRVALLQQMSNPDSPAPAPQRVDVPERPPAARPAEFVAGLRMEPMAPSAALPATYRGVAEPFRTGPFRGVAVRD